MKINKNKGFVFTLGSGFYLCVLLTGVQPLCAADGTWLAGSGDGNWSDTSKWNGGTIADGVDSKLTIQTPDGSVAPGPGELLGGYTITLDSNRTLGRIELAAGSWSNSSAITISGNNTLHFGTSSGPARVSGAGGNVLKLAIEVNEVTSNVGELIFDGPGITHWNPGTMSHTGFVTLNTGVLATRGGVFGSAATNTIYMNGSSAKMWVDSTDGNFAVANNIELGSASNLYGMEWYRGNSNAVTFSGDIYQSNPAANISLYYWTSTSALQQRYVVSGNNSYTGETQIGGDEVLVLAQSSTAFGTGANGSVTLYNTAAGVGLSGGINVANNLVLRGAGYSGAGFDSVEWSGGLFNQADDNTWSGGIDLGPAANPGIGVAAGTKLTVSGVITGNAAGGLVKTGAGVLELTNTNTFSTGATIAAGTVIASNTQALGTGTTGISGTGKLEISEGIDLGLSGISLADDAALSFNLNDLFAATLISVTGDLAGTGTYIVNIADAGGFTNGTYTLMTVSGATGAVNFALGTFVSGFSGDLEWDGGVLSLNVIPEPGSAMLFILGSILLVRRSRRVR